MSGGCPKLSKKQKDAMGLMKEYIEKEIVHEGKLLQTEEVVSNKLGNIPEIRLLTLRSLREIVNEKYVKVLKSRTPKYKRINAISTEKEVAKKETS